MCETTFYILLHDEFIYIGYLGKHLHINYSHTEGKMAEKFWMTMQLQMLRIQFLHNSDLRKSKSSYSITTASLLGSHQLTS